MIYGSRRHAPPQRRGAPRPHRRKKRKRVRVGARVSSPRSQGFESFLVSSHYEEKSFSLLVSRSGGVDGEETQPVKSRSRARTRREGLLLSVILHLLIAIVLIVDPEFLDLERAGKTPEVSKPERLVLFMDEPEPEALPEPQLVPLPPELAQQPDNRLIIPKATRPPPADKEQEFQNDLPFSEGNTDEFVTDEENLDPGEEGEPGEDVEEVESEDEEPGTGESEEGSTDETTEESSEQKLAEFLRRERLSFPEQRPIFEPPVERVRPPTPPPPAGYRQRGEEGEDGEGGAFEDIRRFLLDKRFENPEGGLVTGLGRTLYYNDKGAHFVPWIRRMLAEVRRNFMMPYSGSFMAGHVAVGVVVRRDGDIAELNVLMPSGTTGFNNAAVGALRAADLMPLPNDYPDQEFEFILVFWINEKPYDLY